MKKEEKRKNFKALFSLYGSFILNLKTIIAIFISLSILALALYYLSRIDDMKSYMANPLIYHESYFNLSILIINLLNGILIAFFALNISINSLSFDILFIPYVRRGRLSIIKLLTIFIILFILLTLEFIIISLIALFQFKCYKMDYNFVISFYYSYISIIFEALVSIALTEIFNVIITPLFVLFLFLIIRILMNNYNNIKDLFYDYIPYLIYNAKDNLFEFGNSIVSITLIISLIIIYIQIYSIKDIKWKHFIFNIF